MLHSYTMWNIFLYIPFYTSISNTPSKVYKTIFIKFNLEQNITIFSFIAHGFFNILTSEMVNDLKGAPSKKRALGPNEISSKFSL